jgi:hypothetical protein
MSLIEKNEMDGACSMYGRREVPYMSLVERPEGRILLGRPRCRWDDNIKMDLIDIGWGRDWIGMAQDRDRWRAVL